MPRDDASTEVMRRERELLDPLVRRQPRSIRALLHPEFVEFGASGQIWDTDSIVLALSGEPDGPPVRVSDLVAAPLGPDVVLLTYRTVAATRHCLRTSVWVREPDGPWLLRFHQATVEPAGSDG